MKSDIHPKVRAVIFQDTVTGAQFRILSSIKTEATVTVDGTEYPLCKVDVSASSHPFYTGKTKVSEVGGRVDKFKKRFASLGSK